MANAMQDVVAFTKLNDSIFDTIKYLGEKETCELLSKDPTTTEKSVYHKTMTILTRLEKRDLYSMVAEVLVPDVFAAKVGNEKMILNEILEHSGE